jgi:maltooligosyltrehalose trehalohydrolase
MLGANVQRDLTEFRVWAPKAQRVTLCLVGKNGCLQELAMEPATGGEFGLSAKAGPGDRYFYLLDDDPLQLPDPVSRFLPDGVHGPTEIVDPDSFSWTDQQWRGVPYGEYILYELHVGTFTHEGAFDSAIEKLDYLKDLGITAVELMPVAAFPGKRNWGYDGVSLYAAQESYGGPDALKRFVDAAHEKGLAVVLDVVYNHLGNEGNYLSRFAPYFTHKHSTPWGDAINFDDRDCRYVREYIIENALYWIREYHVDGLRMDAVHAIKDDSPVHILAELRDRVQQFASAARRDITLVAESDENSPRYVRPREQHGYGLDGIWSDDFHHAAHALFTGENEGYYMDFGRVDQLVKALREGFVFQGEEFKFWGKPRGEAPWDLPLESHVICIQNHDQVGNRALGERLTSLIPIGARRILAALLLLAPETPLLWMGQEYDEQNPFQFFTDYGDPALQKAVREGRRNEFKDFKRFEEEIPDPQDAATFTRSKLSWIRDPQQQHTLDWYRQLLCLRGKLYSGDARRTCRVGAQGGTQLVMQIPATQPEVVVCANWSGAHIAAPEHLMRMLEFRAEQYAVAVFATDELLNNVRRLCA